MGIYDSSHTRVKPVFDKLLARDQTGQSWLPTLLALPRRQGTAPHTGVPHPGPLTDHAWGEEERRLSPPRGLLRWLVEQATLSDAEVAKDGGKTRAKREALLTRDPTTIAEALALLTRPTLPDSAWYILEGQSQPDVYLETAELLVVIEGKRTERHVTRTTRWMPVRDQMLRHLDAAWEIRGNRKLVGFLIVEGKGGAADLSLPSAWEIAAQATVSSGIVDASLPHRTPEEREAIAAAFLGITTWQRVCAALSLDYTTLPNT